MRWPEEHRSVDAENLADVCVDNAAMTRHDDPLARMRGENALDGVGGPMSELVLAFRVGVDIPRAVADEALPRSVQRTFAF